MNPFRHNQKSLQRSFSQRIFLVSLCSLLPLLTFGQKITAQGTASAHVQTPDLTKSTPVDERLFLLQLHAELPNLQDFSGTDPAQIEQTLAQWRQRLLIHGTDIEQRKLDDTLAELYHRQIKLVDKISEYLGQIGVIEKKATESQAKNLLSSSYQAGFAGVSAGLSVSEALAKQNQINGITDQSTTPEGIIAGAAVGLLSFLVDQYQKDQAVDAERQKAFESAHLELARFVSQYEAACEVGALRLSEKYGWPKGAAPTPPKAEELAKINALVHANNLHELLRYMDGKVASSPDNLFWVVPRMLLYDRGDTSVKQLLELAAEGEKLAARLPTSALYQAYRAHLVHACAEVTVTAVLRSQKGSSRLRGCGELAPLGVARWEACLALEPEDSTGELRERKAWMLQLDAKPEEALALAKEVESLRKEVPRYAFNRCLLHSTLGQTEEALTWLKHAVRVRGMDIKRFHEDVDFKALKEAEPEAFRAILQPQWKWDLQYGIFNDDILLRNDSTYPLTGVVFRPTIHAGGKEWSPVLKAEIIQPGEVYRWSNVVSIPNSRYDNVTLSFQCDQDVP